MRLVSLWKTFENVSQLEYRNQKVHVRFIVQIYVFTLPTPYPLKIYMKLVPNIVWKLSIVNNEQDEQRKYSFQSSYLHKRKDNLAPAQFVMLTKEHPRSKKSCTFFIIYYNRSYFRIEYIFTFFPHLVSYYNFLKFIYCFFNLMSQLAKKRSDQNYCRHYQWIINTDLKSKNTLVRYKIKFSLNNLQKLSSFVNLCK